MKLTIKNFGPIKDIEFEPKPFSIFIGPQAEGKSTINKLLFFFLHVRDEITAVMRDTIQSNSSDIAFALLQNKISNRWFSIFGLMLLEKNTHVVFDYGNSHTLEITVPETGEFLPPVFTFSQDMFGKIIEAYKEGCKCISEAQNNRSLFYSAEAEMAVTTASKNIIGSVKDIFRFNDELLYIPAGRSSISIFNEYIGKMNTEKTDYLMGKFIDKIDYVKPKVTIANSFWLKMKLLRVETRKVVDWYNEILKGRYVYDSAKSTGSLFVDDKNLISINFASSGQQEVLWILHFLLFIVNDGIKTKVFIEEPEAHLFPDSQKVLMELISYVHKKTGSEFYITTHSPYILTATNNLIYAANVGKTNPEATSAIIPEDTWLPQEDVAGYFVSGGGMEDILSKDLGMIKAEMIDQVSAKIEEDYGKLYEIQHGNDSE